MPSAVRKRWKTIPVRSRVVDDTNRTILWTGTTSAIDRDGEVIDPKGMNLKNFMANPVIQFGHDYSSRPVARAEKIRVTDQGIDFQLRFPTEEEAGEEWYKYSDSIYRLSANGFLNATSVGFRINSWPETDPKGDGKTVPYRVFDDTELLELSIVPVPANPEALNSGIEKGWFGTAQDRAFMDEWVRAATSNLDHIKWADTIEKWLDTWQASLDTGEDDMGDLREILTRLERIESFLTRQFAVSETDGTESDPVKEVTGEDATRPEATETIDDQWVKDMIREIESPSPEAEEG